MLLVVAEPRRASAAGEKLCSKLHRNGLNPQIVSLECLAWNRNISQILWCISDKLGKSLFLGRGGPFKTKEGRLLDRTFCLPNSKWTNQVSSPPVDVHTHTNTLTGWERFRWELFKVDLSKLSTNRDPAALGGDLICWQETELKARRESSVLGWWLSSCSKYKF